MTLSRLNDALFPKTFFGFDTLFSDGRNGRTAAWPAMDATELDDKYLVQLELPGVAQEDVDITYDNGVLKISGNSSYDRQVTQDDESGNGIKYYVRERHQGSFSRAIRLARQIDVDSISASMNNGVLTIEIPKSGDYQTKRIPIHTPKALE